MTFENRLFVSVDMDEWYQCRWATGSANALWTDIEACWQEVYGSKKPAGEIEIAIDKVLSLFDSLAFKSTFFFTGIIASYYPDLVKKVASQGHEIGCHNYHHEDYEYRPREKFISDLKRSKQLLEDLTGMEISGYRSPNSSIMPTLVEDLESVGFRYNSSITPTRRLFGKFGAFINAPRRPYHPDYQDIGKEGQSRLWEFPWTVLPGLNLPAGSGILHRVMGDLYNWIATWDSLRKGHTAYYFHPYEIYDSDVLNKIARRRISINIFLNRVGSSYYSSLERFLFSHQKRLVSGRGLLELCENGFAKQPQVKTP